MTDFVLARRNMVENQLRTNKVSDPRVIDAMATVPREAFAPSGRRSVAYIDEPLPLGGGRWLPPPMIAGRMYQLAALGPGDLVLLVGAGTGYGAAILGKLASAVVALEEDEAMAQSAEQALGGVEADNVVVAHGALAAGWPKQAPYDAIVFEGSVEHVPDAILQQLAPNGRLVVAIAGPTGVPVLTVMRKAGDTVAADRVCDANVPLLPGFERAQEFVF
ncbi:MAG: protein-L-isoaspartate O-methyltransferase [Alphaproteobacteria bacterium]|nr:protein-L-isoaspartate O-methyltransferase [Alphaproteobacteria bacterium]MCB9928771.1 protein-L-isoaspartate O-methyltransferase [Alphaproteobacteria bacterium]